ncbi:hypothetical protein HHK36_019884 [Tetracentron sinense]|uniref:RING-type E3 ubiquitin transferase n=1 Tax=Tetracentron sinense TaxID=13715 RepID=A0A835DD63_TETSI|nr:hypothetical protein HHK36_019884 [Tetracentron sinense]
MSSSDGRETYWCHECDMSVSLFSPSPPLSCPHCNGDFLEEMESSLSPNPNSPFPPPLSAYLDDPFPILSQTQTQTLTLTPTTNDDDLNFQIPNATIRVAAGPYLDRLIQHLADPDDDATAYHRQGSTPASKSSVESIPNIKITSSFLDSDTILCAVCKDQFVVDVEAKQLPCNHIYHFDCILPWLSHHNSCPVCRFCLPIDDSDDVDAVERRSSRGDSVALTFGNLMEDEDFFGIGTTLRHIARRHRLVVPVRSSSVDVDSPTRMAQAETSSAGPANSGETVSSCPVEGGGRVVAGGSGVISRVDEDVFPGEFSDYGQRIVVEMELEGNMLVKVVMFVIVQALVYFILSNSSDIFSKTKMRSLSFKTARSVSVGRILASISDSPSGGEPSPKLSLRGSQSPTDESSGIRYDHRF